jgi:hypothetical protein
MNSPGLGQPVLRLLKRTEKDPARLLATLYGALQSRNSETLRQVAVIAGDRKKLPLSELVRQAYAKISNDAKVMIEYLGKRKLGKPLTK